MQSQLMPQDNKIAVWQNNYTSKLIKEKYTKESI